jgi:cell division transport system permease protein
VSKRTSFVAVGMIAMSLLILGSFLLVSENLSRAVERWQGRSRVAIYFEPGATPAQIRAVEQHVSTLPNLTGRRLVSREEALDRFREYFSNLSQVVGQLDENPFPASIEGEVPPEIARTPAFEERMNVVRAMPGVEQVQYDWEWLSRLRRLVHLVNLVGIIAGGVLAVAAAFTIANVIRLTMMLYREEIQIMRLVGATERIIRGPFLIEGLLQGTIGGIVAVILLFAAFLSMRHLLQPSASLLWGFLFAGFLPWQKLAALVVAGMAAGTIGSWLSVRETADEI